MKRTLLLMSTAGATAPVFAHPGSAQAHEALSNAGHLVLTAVPWVSVLALVGLTAYGILRRKA